MQYSILIVENENVILYNVCIFILQNELKVNQNTLSFWKLMNFEKN